MVELNTCHEPMIILGYLFKKTLNEIKKQFTYFLIIVFYGSPRAYQLGFNSFDMLHVLVIIN